MSTVTRTWLAFAALGTGMIHLALVLGSPLPVAAALIVFGLAEVAWAVITLARDRIRAPRAVLAAALIPILGWGLLVATAAALGSPTVASSLGLTAMGIATVLELFIAATVAVQLRRGVDFARPSRTPAVGRYLAGLLLGALAVAALTTGALATTEAGLYAQPHGEHIDTFVPQRDTPQGDESGDGSAETGKTTLNLPQHSGH